MNNFGPILNRYIDASGVNQSSLATSAGIAPSNMSRITRGLILPSSETLDAILQQIPDRSIKMGLVEAYVLDSLGEEARETIKNRSDILYERLSKHTTLTPRGQSALDHLIKLRPQVPSIEDVFIELATCMGWKEGTTGRLVYPSARTPEAMNDAPPKKEKTLADGKRAARQ